jgi:hypothetical protein
MPDPYEDPLAGELRELAGWLAVPPAPELGPAVRARLVAVSSAAPRRPRRWRVLVAAVAAALLVAALPPARAAVAHAVVGILHFAGVRVEPGAVRLAPTPSPLPSAHSVALDAARQRARFPIRVPTRLGVPDDVQLADPGPDGAPRVVSLIYRGGAVRVDEFDGRLNLGFLKGDATGDAHWVEIGTGTGLWFPRPHAVEYIDRDGTTRTETARLAAPTLIWSDGTVSYRIEGLSYDDAVAVALSLA